MSGVAGAAGGQATEARPTASLAIVSTHGVAALRAALHGIKETVTDQCEIIVLAAQHYDDVVGYVTRHYLRGDISAIGLETDEEPVAHCGLDHAIQFSSGEVLVRLEDDLEFTPGWLDLTLATLAGHPEIGMLGLIQVPEKRRRGRPPKAPRGPEPVEAIDLRAFAVRRDLFVRHERELMGECCGEGCRYQTRLPELGYTLAYLPGQLRLAQQGVRAAAGGEFEADLPFHAGAGEAMGRLRQVYQLGEEVLLPCMACGEDDFEVLAAHIEFCETHDVPIGYMYALRCTTCGGLHDEEDLQFRCP